MLNEREPIVEPAVLGVAQFGSVSGVPLSPEQVVLMAGMTAGTPNHCKCGCCGTTMRQIGPACHVCPNCGEGD